tara:strand:+ start:9922 stop:10680 length:759 start_codon:yes stop_codon:yes gene_type:complete
MPCVNCRNIYNETGIKTPHYYFGNRTSCCFPGGSRTEMLVACVRIIPNDILSGIFEEHTLGVVGCREITNKWSSMSNEQRVTCLEVLIQVWATSISEEINRRYGSARSNQPSSGHYIAYSAAIALTERNGQNEVIESHPQNIRTSIFKYFKRAHTEYRVRFERLVARTRAEMRARVETIANVPKKMLTAPIPSTNVHMSSECPVCLNEFKSECGTTVTSCGHKLCIACFANIIIKDTKNKISCPICRSVVLS